MLIEWRIGLCNRGKQHFWLALWECSQELFQHTSGLEFYRHDTMRRAAKNIHDLREEIRHTLIRYLEDRVQDTKEKHVVKTLKTGFRRPIREDDEGDEP